MTREKRVVIGLMSGTSADGVDAALVETDGEGHVRPLAFHERPYRADERALIRRAAARALELAAPAPDPLIEEAEAVLTRAHAEAVAALPGGERATLIGFHGQTVAHRPPSSGHRPAFTWQIGRADALARATGRPVVHDFRSNDIAAGGEGAPFAPGFHRALLGACDEGVAILNLGGVGNLTWIAPDGAWGAFDTGPGNGLIDDWAALQAAGPCDRDGALAAAGQVHESLIALLLEGAEWDRPGPRALDRGDFTLAPVRTLSAADGAATLTALTAETVRLALLSIGRPMARLWVTGGGRRNPVLMAMLAERTGLACGPVERLGWNGDALEAQAFAWLAVRHVEGLPLSWPETTGVPAPTRGGRLALPA